MEEVTATSREGLEYPRSCIWTSTFQAAMPGELKSTWNFELEGTSIQPDWKVEVHPTSSKSLGGLCMHLDLDIKI